ncbi:MAG TPA: hypothetical protein VMT55_05100 [Candidatus Sulfotelmatobacter sp.]|nr:hypothetical protein [Candidatus Sulfotelmatobacter sp.]
MDNPVKKKFEFSFKIDHDRLLELSKTSIAGRLQWLEEANNFIASIDGGKLMRQWQKSRENDL